MSESRQPLAHFIVGRDESPGLGGRFEDPQPPRPSLTWQLTTTVASDFNHSKSGMSTRGSFEDSGLKDFIRSCLDSTSTAHLIKLLHRIEQIRPAHLGRLELYPPLGRISTEKSF